MNAKRLFDPYTQTWHQPGQLKPLEFRCGYCDQMVASDKGYKITKKGAGQHEPQVGAIYICPNCYRPSTSFPHEEIWPSAALGESVSSVPTKTYELYLEARRCTAASAHTAAVLLCRKILMHLAVEKGAPEGKTFFSYVEYLADNNYVPPDGKGWVDHIRKKGNEATHEIVVMEREDAGDLLAFVAMLLRIIYEFPAKIAASSTPPSSGKS